MDDNLFEDDLDEKFDTNEFGDDEIDLEARIKQSLNKIISSIRFDIDDDLLDILYLEFTDNSILTLRCSRNNDESFIFVDEESFPQFVGAKILDVEVFEDYSGDDVFDAELEYIVFKTDKGELEIDFENGGKLVNATDDVYEYEEDYLKRSKKLKSRTLTNFIALYWMGKL